MHSSVLVFYDNANDDMESIINRYYQDNEDEFKNEIQVPKENIKEATAEVLSKEYWINDLKSYARYKKMKPVDFLSEYHGYEIDDQGNLFSRYNPNGMFDYYIVGGRWKNCLVLKDKVVKSKRRTQFNDAFANITDVESFFNKPNLVSHAMVKDIDWDKTAELSKLYYIDYYNRQSDDFKDKNTMDDYLKENYNGIVTFFSSVIIDGDWISDIDKVELEIIITDIKNSKNESMAVAVIDYHN